MKKTFVTLMSAAAFLTASPVWADSNVVGDDDKFVYIQTDGMGTSKIEALNSAWMEAIRTAVGMYMTGSTKINSDDLQETIATYSRGKVKNYEVLSEKQQDGLWCIAIKAAVEKDMLIQSEKSIKKKSLGAAKLASLVTSAGQSKDARAIVDNFTIYESPEQCLDYSFDIQNINGKIYALYLIKVNSKKFNDIVVKNISQLLNEFAEAKFEVLQRPSADYANHLAKNSNIMAIPEDCSSLTSGRGNRIRIEPGTTLLSDQYYELYKEIAPFDHYSCLPSKYKSHDFWQLSQRTISVASNLKKCQAYILQNQTLVDNIINKISGTEYSISFFTDIECGSESFRFESDSFGVVFFADPDSRCISPLMKVKHNYSGGGNCFNIFVAHELDIPQSKISQITNINGGYELTDKK